MWLQKPGILFNGALHWFWYDLNKMPLIVSFDLANEEFKEIPQPDDTRYVWNIGCTLGIMNGRLCIFPYFDDDEDLPSCGIWLIKNYNTKPSWELLSKDNEMNDDHAIHYILNNDTSRSRIMSAYSCDENIQLSRRNIFPLLSLCKHLYLLLLIIIIMMDKVTQRITRAPLTLRKRERSRKFLAWKKVRRERDFYRPSGSRNRAEIRTSQDISFD